MTFSFIITGRLAGANEIKSANRSHWSVGKKLAAENIETARSSIYQAKDYADSHFKQPVAITIAWVEPNARRDPDNIMAGQKAILDALVLCHVLPNDTRAWVKSLVHSFPDPDPKNPRIEVFLVSL